MIYVCIHSCDVRRSGYDVYIYAICAIQKEDRALGMLLQTLQAHPGALAATSLVSGAARIHDRCIRGLCPACHAESDGTHCTCHNCGIPSERVQPQPRAPRDSPIAATCKIRRVLTR